MATMDKDARRRRIRELMKSGVLRQRGVHKDMTAEEAAARPEPLPPTGSCPVCTNQDRLIPPGLCSSCHKIYLEERSGTGEG
jgi:hypothetical protein